MNFEHSVSFAREMDQHDPLRTFRDLFHIPQHQEHDTVYLTGNSLGLQPRSTAAYIQRELDDWARWGVEGHFQAASPWLSYHEQFTGLLSPIVGCLPDEVVVMNQLTVNLHLLMISFYRPTPQRYKIICEAKAFPSDQYAIESQVAFHGYDPQEAIIEVAPRPGEHMIRPEDVLETIDRHGDTLALVLFGGVNYYTGQLFDMPAITEAAHRVGALAGFDLAHAAGNVSLDLHSWNVDFACWCSYKYLNSGPGGVAGIYIHEKWARDKTVPRLAGWWGYRKDTRFMMEKGFDPIPTAEGWQLSNAPVLSMAAHKASLDIFEKAGMDRLHAKREKLSAYLHSVLNSINEQKGKEVMEIITPPEWCGCQVSLLMKEKGKEIFNALSDKGVIADWREPNVIRVAPVPLYNTFEDVWRFGQVIESIVN